MFKRGLLIIILIALLATPVFYATATDLGGSWAQATAFITKEFGLDLVARVIARTLLNKMVSGLITKIQTGGEGGKPAFVQNWRNFQTDAQYRGEDVFRSILAGTKLCGYFEKDIKGLFKAGNELKSLGQNLRVDNFDPFKLRTNCTMPSNFNIANYQKDFAGNGGWNAWSRMLEPQNNYYGALFGSLDEAARQRNLEAQAGAQEAQAGSGYTSIRGACKNQLAGTVQEGPTQPSQARCTFMGKVFTPADLLGKTAASTIDKDLSWLVTSDELSEVVINVITASINRLANLATSKAANDYATAPEVRDPTQDNYKACINSCNALGADSPDYQACTLQCSRDTGAPIPEPIPPTEPPPGGAEVPPPADALTKHSDKSGVVSAAKQELIKEGMTFSVSSPECPDRFAITKRAVQKIGEGAGYLDKPGGNNCEGKAVDIIAYPDGYIYDILSGSAADGNGPMWSPTGCGPTGGNGTCPDRYRVP